MRAVISHAVPNVTIESLQPLPSARLQRDVVVKVSDGRTFILTIPAAPMLRLLRSEQWLLLSEALVIRWIFRKLLEHIPRDKRISIKYLVEAEPTEEDSPPTPAASLEGEPVPTRLLEESLLRYLPALITHSSSSPELGIAFNLLEPTRGSPVSSLLEPLTTAERMAIDFQKGQLIRRISDFTAPNSRFGPAIAVIGPPTASRERSATPALVGSGGVETWTKAFLALVEGILRDGEDLAVMMSYSLIRGHVQRLSHLLDAVTQSRLVVLDAGSDANVLVFRSTNPRDGAAEASSVPATAAETTLTSLAQPVSREDRSKGKVRESGAIENPEESIEKQTREELPDVKVKIEDEDEDEAVDEDGATEAPAITVTGLRDWSNSIFGDPLMSFVFNQDPSPEFLRGFSRHSPPPSFHRDPTTSRIATYRTLFSSPPPDIKPAVTASDEGEEQEDLIEDRDNAPVRLLLYECYHAAVAVVQQFYRPGHDSTRREMAARRRLATVLNKLAEVDETTGKRARRPSEDSWPVKKARSDNGDESMRGTRSMSRD
jgi:hypothetical protein